MIWQGERGIKVNTNKWLSKKRVAIMSGISVLILVASFGTKTALDVKTFSQSIRENQSTSRTEGAVQALNGDLDILMKISSTPIISQMLSASGLNFKEIKGELSSMIAVAPPLLGNTRPLKYLVSFQNSAEARGTGGILGAYAVLEFNKGKISVIKTGSNASLYSISLKKIPVDVPNEFLKLYGQNPAILQNSNLSPHFPYGAEIWMGLWKEKFGEELDGVIAIDPEALSYLLKATGDITLPSGEKITSSNIVEETLKNAYKRYETNNDARKQYLVDILNATANKIQNGQYSKIEMAKAMKDAILQNRLLVYSTDKKVEAELSTSRLGGFMKTDPNNEFRAVIQNIDASKLDYYLDRKVLINSTGCKVPKTTQVKVTVKNTLTSGVGLPAYVLTRADKKKPAELVTGSHRFKVFIYGPVGARLVSVSRENRIADLGGASTERKRPIYVADVDLAPGQSEELLANFSGGKGRITFIDQPLVRPTQIKITDKC